MQQNSTNLETASMTVADAHTEIDLLNDTAWNLLHVEPQRSQALCEQARHLALQDSVPYANGLANSLLILSIIEWSVSNYQDALPLALDAQPLFQSVGNVARQAYTLNHIAGIHFYLGNYDQAFDLGMQAINMCEEIGDRSLEASILNDTGFVCLHLQNFPDALSWLFKSLNIHRELVDKRGEAYTLDSISKAYYLMGDYAQALSFGQQSLECAREIGHQRGEIEALERLGEIYAASNDETRALEHFEWALALARQNKVKQFEASSLLAIGNLYIRRHEIDRALEYLCLALTLAQDMNSKQAVYEAHQSLATAYKERSDFQKALAHYEQFHAIKDEIFNERSDNRLRSLQVVHNVETTRKETEIYRLRNLALQQEVHEREKIIVELDAFAHTVAHDLKGPVSIVMGYSEVLQDLIAQSGDAEALAMTEILQKIGRKIIRIVDNLLLLASVRDQEIISQPLDVEQIIVEVESRLAEPIAQQNAHLIKPVSWPQEALGYAPWVEEIWVNYISNAMKYGGTPPQIELGATPEKSGIRFWVRDNGIGLTSEAKTQLFVEFARVGPSQISGYGLGLSIVRRITEKLGGTVGVESAGPGQGSTFSFTLPTYK